MVCPFEAVKLGLELVFPMMSFIRPQKSSKVTILRKDSCQLLKQRLHRAKIVIWIPHCSSSLMSCQMTSHVFFTVPSLAKHKHSFVVKTSFGCHERLESKPHWPVLFSILINSWFFKVFSSNLELFVVIRVIPISRQVQAMGRQFFVDRIIPKVMRFHCNIGEEVTMSSCWGEVSCIKFHLPRYTKCTFNLRQVALCHWNILVVLDGYILHNKV
mmetsp:Transcript_39283/g.81512  ORF Transcript_39283/g.81512 Transcript_39283/m.81512 type:complete len:214 (-) Transcript_39283:1141-1782(-)